MLAGPIVSWILLAAGLLLVACSLVLFYWSLFSDRARGRRRCPRCAYAMEGVPGLTCPECGCASTSERGLFKTRRRWRVVPFAIMVFVAGGLSLAHIHMRTLQGTWWNMAPTRILIVLLDKESMEGPRQAISRRVSDGQPWTTLAPTGALSRRNWERLTQQCRSIILNPGYTATGPGAPRPQAWASVTLGCVIPHEDLVDPTIVELLTHETCSVRGLMFGGAYPYFLQREYLPDEMISALATAACDSACPAEASTAAGILPRIAPLPVEAIQDVITCINADPALAGVWVGLQSGFSGGWRLGASPEERLAFIAVLEGSDDPAIRQQAAAMRTAVETAWRPPGTGRGEDGEGQ